MLPHRHAPSQARLIWPPETGWFALRLVRRGWRVPARIARDNTERWFATIDGIDGEPHADPAYAPGVERVWTSGVLIPQCEYDYLLAVKQWAAAHDPSHPSLHPNKPIHPMLMRPFLPD